MDDVDTKDRRNAGERVAVRFHAEALASVDKWRLAQPDRPSRAEAIRRLIELGQTVSPVSSRKGTRQRAAGAAFAKKAAGDQINWLQRESGASEATKTERQRRLTKVPAELSARKPRKGAKS